MEQTSIYYSKSCSKNSRNGIKGPPARTYPAQDIVVVCIMVNRDGSDAMIECTEIFIAEELRGVPEYSVNSTMYAVE